MYESKLPVSNISWACQDCSRKKSIESILTATMKTVDMRNAESELQYFSIFATVLTLHYYKLALFINRFKKLCNLLFISLLCWAKSCSQFFVCFSSKCQTPYNKLFINLGLSVQTSPYGLGLYQKNLGPIFLCTDLALG